MTSTHFTFSLPGVSKCVCHAPGSLIMCLGSLVVRPPGIPNYFQNFPDIMLAEADSAQASRRCLSEFSSRSIIFQKLPDYIFRICQYADISPPNFDVSSMIHVHLAVMSQPSIGRNKRHHAAPSFLSVVGYLEILMQWFAFVSLLQRNWC